MIEKLEEKAYFYIGGNEYYEGYHIKDRHWYGFATPNFEKYIADLIVYNFSKSNYITHYDNENECYYIIGYEKDKIIENYKVEKHTINTIDGIKEVYNFGSLGWAWECYTFDEVKKLPNSNIINNKQIEKDEFLNMDY